MTKNDVLAILEKYKLHMPPTVYYELQADIVNVEEPTPKYDVTENCIACKYDEDDYKAERCKKCLAGDSQFEPDDAFIDDFHADDIPTITITIEEYMKLRECEDKCKAGVEPTPKNDLGVDCISRTDVLKLIYDYKEKHSENREEYPINYMTLLDMMRWVIALPSVTPQEPRKGHWVHGEYCSECGCDVPAYIIDWKWQKDMDAKYCPNCGCRMVEPQKGEDKK